MTVGRMTLIKVTLDLSQRWAVGGVALGTEQVDLPVLVDPRPSTPAPYLPTTGLVGSLRGHLGSGAEEWLGPTPQEFEETTGSLSGSVDKRRGALQFLGVLPVDAMIDRRGATAVDGARGAAASGSLRTEQWTDPTTATLVCLHDGSANDDLLDALFGWRPIVGRSRSTGLGQATVTGVEAATNDLARPEHRRWWLFHRDEWLRDDGALPDEVKPDSARNRKEHQARDSTDHPGSAPCVLDVTFTTVERVHIGVDENAEKHEGHSAQRTLRSRRRRAPQDGGLLTVPGSTWKGCYRHRCQTILRLIGATTSEIDSIVDCLFGSSARGRGLLSFSDTTAPGTVHHVRTHVAIDRFTGGARDGALVKVLAIPEGEDLDLHISADHALDAASENLLLHVTRDLHEGLIGIGGHQTRGYGTVKADGAVHARFVELPTVDLPALVQAVRQESFE